MQTIIKERTKNYLLDLKSQRITMLDGRFYFAEDGTAIPSVTTVLICISKRRCVL
jgi:hypothetical protein